MLYLRIEQPNFYYNMVPYYSNNERSPYFGLYYFNLKILFFTEHRLYTIPKDSIISEAEYKQLMDLIEVPMQLKVY